MSTMSKQEKENLKQFCEERKEEISRMLFNEFEKVLDSYLNQEKITESECEVSGGMKKKDDIENQITKMLSQLGIPRHLKGFYYLREAIISSLSHKELLDVITKRLYPEIAKKFGTTSSRVERAIRHAIEVGCDRGNPEYLEMLFGYTIGSFRTKPTNSEFIALIVDEIELHNM